MSDGIKYAYEQEPKKTTEWKDLPTLQDVAEAQAQGWEIEFANSSSEVFARWSGIAWHADCLFRARPHQPKMKKVKQMCFFSASGIRYDVLENGRQHKLSSSAMGWTRVPSEDKEIEVPE